MKSYRYINRLSLQNRLTRLSWNLICALFFRMTPRWAFHGWRRWLLQSFGATIGAGCRIDPSARIWLPSNLVLGDYVAIGEGVELYCVDRIVIGSKVAISQRAFLCTASHDISSLARPLTEAGITIGDHAWIAAEAMILPGVRIGEGSVIAARAVLRNDADRWSVYAGNPAHKVADRKIATDVSSQIVVRSKL